MYQFCPDCERPINNFTGAIKVHVEWSDQVSADHIICKECAVKYPSADFDGVVRMSSYEWLRIIDSE